MVRIDRVTGETMSIRPQPDRASRRCAGTGIRRSSCRRTIRKSSTRRPTRCSDRPNRGLNWEAIGADLTTNDNRDDDRHDGREGQRHPHLARTTASRRGRRSSRSRSRRSARACSTPAPTTATCRCRATAGKIVDEGRRQDAGPAEGHLGVGGRAVAIRRGHRLRDVRRSPPERLRDLHLRQQRLRQTWQSSSANLKGEVAKTLTEDQKNPDVLYLGTETGLFVSIDRAKSWTRIKANLPTVRIDEITLHPRDNAMILATHGRAIWILDHLEPIQEYAAAQATTTDARLFTPPPYAMYRRPARDRELRVLGRPDVLRREPAAGGGRSRGSTRSRSAT